MITDIRMPPNCADEGLQAALKIRSLHPKIGIGVLSQYVQRRYAVELVAGSTGAVGYLLKQRIDDIPIFCADLERGAAGGTVLDPEVVALMVARADRERPPVRQLTSRQLQVLALMAEGRTNASIAHHLTITERAVVQHVSHIYDHLTLPPSQDDHPRVLAVLHYLAQ